MERGGGVGVRGRGRGRERGGVRYVGNVYASPEPSPHPEGGLKIE
jgi:hypothetical protein